MGRLKGVVSIAVVDLRLDGEVLPPTYIDDVRTLHHLVL